MIIGWMNLSYTFPSYWIMSSANILIFLISPPENYYPLIRSHLVHLPIKSLLVDLDLRKQNIIRRKVLMIVRSRILNYFIINIFV